jgi:hypothetical protein
MTGVAKLVIAVGIAVSGVQAVPNAAHAAPAAAASRLEAENARLSAENARLKHEAEMMSKFAPHQPAWWEQSLFQSLVVGLIVGLVLAAVGNRYTKLQQRAGLTMDMLKLWLDVWWTSYAKGMVPLKVSGLDIDQDVLEALEKLGNLYEIIAIAVADKAVDARALENYGMRVVNGDFRTLLATTAEMVPVGTTQTQARDAIKADLVRWNRGAKWA